MNKCPNCDRALSDVDECTADMCQGKVLAMFGNRLPPDVEQIISDNMAALYDGKPVPDKEREQLIACRDALAELVRLKDLKDKSNTAKALSDGSWVAMMDDYSRRAPAAWAAARTVLERKECSE